MLDSLLHSRQSAGISQTQQLFVETLLCICGPRVMAVCRTSRTTLLPALLARTG